jgi:uncharacterized membrane protein YgcG
MPKSDGRQVKPEFRASSAGKGAHEANDTSEHHQMVRITVVASIVILLAPAFVLPASAAGRRIDTPEEWACIAAAQFCVGMCNANHGGYDWDSPVTRDLQDCYDECDSDLKACWPTGMELPDLARIADVKKPRPNMSVINPNLSLSGGSSDNGNGGTGGGGPGGGFNPNSNASTNNAGASTGGAGGGVIY